MAPESEIAPGLGAFLSDPDVTIAHVGPARTGGAAVYIWRDAATALVDACRSTDERLHVGLLVGRYGTAPAGELLEIRGWSDFEPYATLDAFRIDLNKNWELTLNRLQRAHREQVLVGWVVTQRRSAGRLGPLTTMVHRSLFGKPWQVLVVADPDAEALAVWGLATDGTLQNISFNIAGRGALQGDEHADP